LVATIQSAATVEDAGPGSTDRYHGTGNEVVIDLGSSEYAVFGHVIPGSIAVHPGQAVRAGDVVGLIGNSGNSSEPHLHFQVSNAPRLIDARALPAPFDRVLLDGVRTEHSLPAEGAQVSAIEP